jgi:hypothetical protein
MRLVNKSDLVLIGLTEAVCFACVVQEIAIFLAMAPPHVKESPVTLMRIAFFYAITPVTIFALGVYWAALRFTYEDEQALARTAPHNYGSLSSTVG